MTLRIPQPRPAADVGEAGHWDALEMPEAAGRAVLARPGVHDGPALLTAPGRMALLLPEGSAEEVPGLLAWLEWDGVDLGLVPRVAWAPTARADPRIPRRADQRWVRPPGHGTGSSAAAHTGADLTRLVGVAASECLRTRFDRTAVEDGPRRQSQADAFSYASRMLAGTRPRSFTS